MERFYSIKHLTYIMVRCSYRGCGKFIYHNYITLLIFLKSKYFYFKLFPFLLPTLKKYVSRYI